MMAAEKKYRNIKSGRILFSPEASKWIRRAQVYRSLLRLHAGKIRNIGNLKRAARRCGIEEPTKKSLAEIRDRLKVCKDTCNYLKKKWAQVQKEAPYDQAGKGSERKGCESRVAYFKYHTKREGQNLLEEAQL